MYGGDDDNEYVIIVVVVGGVDGGLIHESVIAGLLNTDNE